MKSLYVISTELETLNDLLIEQGGEIDQETANRLMILETELQIKGANYGIVILNNASAINAIDSEIERLAQRKKFLTTANERLKTAVSDAMLHFGIEKIETPIVKLSFRSSEAVEIVDQSSIPDAFLATKTTYTPDKAAIKSAIKNGGEVPGAQLVTNKNLQVK